MPLPTPRLYNGSWYAFWTENRRSKRRKLNATSKREADAEIRAGPKSGAFDAPVRKDSLPTEPTVAECWAVYAKARGTITSEMKWRKLAPHLGHVMVDLVDQFRIDDYVARRAREGVKPQTCRTEIAMLFAALRFCAARPQSLFPASLIQPVKLPDAGPPRDRWLSMGEMQRMLDAAHRLREGGRLSRGERYLWVALEAPARMQAILDLTWDRVDLEHGLIHFADPDGRSSTKRRVSVRISSALQPILERAWRERVSHLVMDDKRCVWALVKRIARHACVERVSPHVLRRTAATMMARNGVPLWKVAKVLGNSLAVVESTYAKWAPEDTAVDMISNGQLGAMQ